MEALTPGGRADLVVIGRLVTPERVRPGAAVVAGGRVIAVTDVEDAPAGVPRLDAGDGYVLPGLIDTHVHFRGPGRRRAEGWGHGSRAAVAGGVTTVIEMPHTAPPLLDPDAVRAEAALVAGCSLVDYAFHLEADPRRPELLARPVPGVAAGAEVRVRLAGRRAASTVVRDPEALERIFAAAAAGDLPLVLHTEDGARSDGGFAALVIGLVRRYGTRTHLLRLSGPRETDLVAVAQAAGLPVTCELTGHRLSLDEAGTRGRDGTDRDRLWAALRAGEVACLSSDHATMPPSRAARETPPGIPGVQELATTVWTEMRRRWPDEDTDTAVLRLVDHLAVRPADLFRLPGKGRLEAGADADLVVFDPEAPWTFSAGDVHAGSGWSAYEGRTMAGRVLTTIRGGDVVWDGATRTFGSATGRWLRPGPPPSGGGTPVPVPVRPAVRSSRDRRPGIDAATFRNAMARLAAPLTVLTCYDSEGREQGLTVSAVGALSLNPPLVLVCLDRGGRSHDIVTKAEALCLHILGPGQEAVAGRFAAREDRFRGMRLAHGRVPELVDVPVRLICSPRELRDGGDHTILVALVDDVTIVDDADGGLVWHRRAVAHAVPADVPAPGPA
ncbi:flavin reductase [Thermomonospora umbrina]|uniref:Dihydroorotase n=1 Tax=Thermomonospora umbrina TaxID=111806 RepID=A0A3D9SK22_9ACTN|nr:flavin reductase [Thermomonospora umbrina]REE96266.1 dihydroorotase [Thermomonospora umbrina]